MDASAIEKRHTKDGSVPAVAYTVDAAVKASGLTRTRLYQLIGAGEIVAKKAGRRTIITAASLHSLIDNLPAATIRAPKQAA